MVNLLAKNLKLTYLAAAISLLAVLFVYQSVFKLELQGDTWQYAWAHQIYYESNVFGYESLKGMRTSLGGASLTFGLIQNNFGLNPIIYYSLSVVFKFLSVVCFFLLARKLTNNLLASIVASVLLSVTFAGVEATHWVFNMYAYIGLTFITLSIYYLLDLPDKFSAKQWAISYTLACLGVWYATMRTSGIIPLILVWSLYRVVIKRNRDSIRNLVFWTVGFILFIVIDKFLLGQMESDYSRYYIIGQGINAVQIQTSMGKYDFLLSPATNLGTAILPDITWYNFEFTKLFSFLGPSQFRTVILPSLAIFAVVSWILSTLLNRGKKASHLITPQYIVLFSLGLIWTIINYIILKAGPLNFQSWLYLALTLFGGYFYIWCIFLVLFKGLPQNLKDLFFITLIWSFIHLLIPLFMNGGPILGTYHRYMVSTAPAVALFIAGLITLGYVYQNRLFRTFVLLVAFLMIFSHGINTKYFFDHKAVVHNREQLGHIWDGFTKVVPNRPEYAKDNPPTIWFEAADNPLDQEILFEDLYFGFLFQASIKYGWNPHAGAGLYHQNYKELVEAVRKDPSLLDELYGVRVENRSVVDITGSLKDKILSDLQ